MEWTCGILWFFILRTHFLRTPSRGAHTSVLPWCHIQPDLTSTWVIMRWRETGIPHSFISHVNDMGPYGSGWTMCSVCKSIHFPASASGTSPWVRRPKTPADPQIPDALTSPRRVAITTQMLALGTLDLMIQTISYPGPLLLLSLGVMEPFFSTKKEHH